MEEETEQVSMIEYAVGLAVREVVVEMVSKEVGIDIMEGRKILMELVKDEMEAPENIRVWFENNI